MVDREDLKQWVVDGLSRAGGSAPVVAVARDIWANHERESRASGDLFYTQQYDMRWAGTQLREAGILEGNDKGQPWKLTRRG